MTLDAEETRTKIEEYVTFLKNVLRPQYDEALEAENEVEMEITEYNNLQKMLRASFGNEQSGIVNDNGIMIDLGHQKVFCRATYNISSDEQKVFVDVGMGLLIELTVNEAISFSDARIKILKRKLASRANKKQQIKQHVQQSEMILDELSRELAKARIF